MYRTLLAGIAGTFATGTLAGILAGTGLAAYTARALPEGPWVLRFQLEDRLFARLMPPTMLATLLVLVLAWALGHGTGRWLFGIAAVCVLAVVTTTVGYEVPLNREVQSWTAWTAPGTWAAVRDRWLWVHLARSLCGAAGFLCALMGVAFSSRLP